MRKLQWLSLVGALWMAGVALGADERPQGTAGEMARVALCDWVVVGTGEARFWLGPAQAEVLARRMRLCHNFALTEPMAMRAFDPGVAAKDVSGVATNVQLMTAAASADYGIGGLITDEGAQLTVQPVVAVRGKTIPWLPKPATVDIDHIWDPQIDQIGVQFTKQTGLRVPPAEIAAMKAYQASSPLAVLELVGNGWRAYAPDAPGAAQAKWREALTLQPECEFALSALAQAAMAERRLLLEQAKEFAIQHVAERPEDAMAYYQLGLIYAEAGLWNDAANAYQMAIKRKGALLDAHLGLGVAYMNLGLLTEAIKEFHLVNQYEPANYKAIYNTGLAYMRKGDSNAAIDLWTRGRQLYPDKQLFRDALLDANRANKNPATQGLQ